MAIGEALAESELTGDELTDAIANRSACGRLIERWRLSKTSGHDGGAHQRGSAPRGAVLWTGPRTQGHLHQRAPLAAGLPAAETHASVRALLARYLYVYGLATPQQFAKWLGIAPRYAAVLFDELGDAVERVLLDSEPSWALPGDARTPSAPHRGVRLLPYFDAYIVPGQPQEWLFLGSAASHTLPPAGQAGKRPRWFGFVRGPFS